MADDDASIGVEGSFDEPELNADPCNFQFKLPNFSFGVNLFFKFPPFEIPIPHLRFALSCDPTKPIDVSGDISYGGGRIASFDLSPDDDDSF